MSHANKCILAAHCSNAGGPKCNTVCGAYIGVHGYNGRGGRVAAAGLPADYARCTLASSPAREAQSAAYRNIDAYAATFKRQFDPDGERVKSLYLYSDAPGTGKTTSAAVLVNEYIIRHYIGSVTRGLTPFERPAYFLDLNAWQTAYNLATMTDNTEELTAVKAQMSVASSAPFCVLDDVGVRSASESFRAMLHTIVNARVTNALPTVYTSNVLIADLKSVFDARLADRIRDMCVEVSFEGGSKRGLRKNV